jgi:putative flippase GtrA
MPMMHCIYCKYFAVGAIVGCTAIVVRELIGILLPSDTPVYYLLSVTLVYAGGIIASFYGHYRVTFSHIRRKRAALESIGKFTIIALIGMGITALLSYQIRYRLGLEPVFGKALPALAFGSATVIASLVTYTLNTRYTFVEEQPGI